MPASVCQLTLVDRIFTRLGANDNILKEQSTFLVEMLESATILRSATALSLVIVDELGRGTSTRDGSSIASAYVKELLKIGCRTVFSTHYHYLMQNLHNNPNVQLQYMVSTES